MPFKFTEITFRDFIEAMRKNGYQKTIGTYVRYDGWGKVYSACAYGQAALNLGVDPAELNEAISRGFMDGRKDGFPDILSLNDNLNVSVPNIAERLQEWADENEGSLDKVIMSKAENINIEE